MVEKSNGAPEVTVVLNHNFPRGSLGCCLQPYSLDEFRSDPRSVIGLWKAYYSPRVPHHNRRNDFVRS
jgi:hypothetical protein